MNRKRRERIVLKILRTNLEFKKIQGSFLFCYPNYKYFVCCYIYTKLIILMNINYNNTFSIEWKIQGVVWSVLIIR